MRDLHISRGRGDDEAVWFNHWGGALPVDPKTRVIVRYRCGALSQSVEAGTHRWQRWPPDVGDTAFDIIAWRYAEHS